jgi:hypothetical protein
LVNILSVQLKKTRIDMGHVLVTIFTAVLIMGCSSKEFSSSTSKIFEGAKGIVNEGSKAINSEG